MKDDSTCSREVEDTSLIEQFLEGDNTAFDQLLLRYQKRIYVQVYHMVPHREDALDLTQEVFLKAFQGLPRFNRRANFYTWLYRIAVNCCIDFLRARGRRPADLQGLYLNHDPPAAQASPLNHIEADEMSQQIRIAVMGLAPKQREIFILRHWENLRISDIARRVKRSEGTVKAQLCHAHRKLRERLRPYVEQGQPTKPDPKMASRKDAYPSSYSPAFTISPCAL